MMMNFYMGNIDEQYEQYLKDHRADMPIQMPEELFETQSTDVESLFVNDWHPLFLRLYPYHDNREFELADDSEIEVFKRVSNNIMVSKSMKSSDIILKAHVLNFLMKRMSPTSGVIIDFMMEIIKQGENPLCYDPRR